MIGKVALALKLQIKKSVKPVSSVNEFDAATIRRTV
jgi:hypothetical protein